MGEACRQLSCLPRSGLANGQPLPGMVLWDEGAYKEESRSHPCRRHGCRRSTIESSGARRCRIDHVPCHDLLSRIGHGSYPVPCPVPLIQNGSDCPYLWTESVSDQAQARHWPWPSWRRGRACHDCKGSPPAYPYRGRRRLSQRLCTERLALAMAAARGSGGVH